MGLGVVASCIQARSSDKFQKMSTMMSAEANDVLDLEQAALAMLIIGLISIFGSLCGIWGTKEENRGPVCFFAIFASMLGLMFVSMMVAMLAFLKSTYPSIVKETNRVCRDPQSAAKLFKCQLPTMASGENVGTMKVQADPIAPKQLRRLAVALLTQSLSGKHQGIGESLSMSFLGMTSTTNSSSVSLPWGRSLSAGTTEVHFLTSICDRLSKIDINEGCASECQLIVSLCEQPDDFDPTTACVCDRLGPRRYAAGPGIVGEVGKGFIQATCPASMTADQGCQGTFCSIPPARQAEGLEEEGCWVLPTTQCGGVPAEPYPGGGDLSTTPYWASGPCTNPDERSKVVLEGYWICLYFVAFTGALGFCMLLSSFCSCCLLCELHTNKRPDQHARNVLFGQETSSDSDDE